MALPQEEWLAQAKRCALHQTMRVKHKHEASCALSVGNKADRYWAYCHRCHEGGVMMKTHVLYGAVAPPKSESMQVPQDCVLVRTAEQATQLAVADFLAKKNMDMQYMPGLTYVSESRKRLIVAGGNGLMGRDTTGKSSQKWLTYSKQHYECVSSTPVPGATRAVVVEDMFSMYKVAYALRLAKVTDVEVFCSLGTQINPALFLRLIQEYTAVVVMYDGDVAGWEGCIAQGMRLRALGIGVNASALQQCAPRDMDPKDMQLAVISRHVEAAFILKGN